MTDRFQARVERDLVVVDGPDATSFLQSLVSQDLDPIPVGGSAHALLLQPQGKLLVDFYAIHVDADTWWCVSERGFGAVLAGGLSRFKIRVKAEIGEVPVAALAVRGVGAPARAGLHTYPVDWGGGPAFDAVGPEAEIDALSRECDALLVGAQAYEAARIEAGVPRQGLDTDERTIPQEAGLELVGVSFTKGCFVGQELVCRIDARGHVNRHLRRLRGHDGETIARGATVTQDGRDVGAVTSAEGAVALAMLRREVEPEAVVDAGGVAAAVEEI
jgi:tRNA-modifying protein YgfZ